MSFVSKVMQMIIDKNGKLACRQQIHVNMWPLFDYS